VIEQKLAFTPRPVLEQKNVYENRLNMSTASAGCSFYWCCDPRCGHGSPSVCWPIHSTTGAWVESHIPGPHNWHRLPRVHGIRGIWRNWCSKPRACM